MNESTLKEARDRAKAAKARMEQLMLELRSVTLTATEDDGENGTTHELRLTEGEWQEPFEGVFLRFLDLPDDNASYFVLCATRGIVTPWHTHDHSQYNHILEGRAIYQTRGEVPSVEMTRTSEPLLIDAGVVHRSRYVTDVVALVAFRPQLPTMPRDDFPRSVEVHPAMP